MTKYREILRLKSLGFSERNIAQSCGTRPHWCQAPLNFHKHINSYLQTEHKVIDL